MTDQKQESPAVQAFRTYAAMEQAVEELLKESPPDEQSLRGAFAAGVLSARKLGLKKEDLLALLSEEWSNWEKYQKMKTAILERRRDQPKK